MISPNPRSRKVRTYQLIDPCHNIHVVVQAPRSHRMNPISTQCSRNLQDDETRLEKHPVGPLGSVPAEHCRSSSTLANVADCAAVRASSRAVDVGLQG